MFTKLKLLLLEIKMHLYGMIHKHYKCMTLRHPYYMDQTLKYQGKIRKTEADYTNLTNKT